MSLIDVENLILEAKEIESRVEELGKKDKQTPEEKDEWRNKLERYRDIMGIDYGYTINSSAAKMFKRLIEEYAK